MWSFLAPIASTLLGGLFGGGARQQQQQQDQFAQQLEGTQNDILKAMFNRAQNTYWPIENQALSGISGRAQSTPFYAGQAEREASDLSKPINLSY